MARREPGRGTDGRRGPDLLTLRLIDGMGRGKEPDAGTVPQAGEPVCWTLFEHAPRGGPDLPDADATPWTHGGPPCVPVGRRRGARPARHRDRGGLPVTEADPRP